MNKPTLSSLIAWMAAAALTACGGGDSAGIGGTVQGLAAGQTVTLQDNGSDSLTVTTGGNFRFAVTLQAGVPYNVSVLTQPVGGICQVANGTGQVDGSGDSVTSIAVACVTTASVGGTVSGLAVGAAVTLTNGTVLLPVAANGPFAFPDVLVAGTSFQVSVAQQPLGQVCTVANGAGTVSATSGSAVTVTCV